MNKPRLFPALVQVVAAARISMSDSEGADLLARASWALTLTTEFFRAGYQGNFPLAPLVGEREKFTLEALLGLAPDRALSQLQELHEVAQERLLPTVLPATHLDLGPTFDGSKLCPADADIIHDGRLVDIKTRVGFLNKKTGACSDNLSLTDLYQILAYILFDRSDSYQI